MPDVRAFNAQYRFLSNFYASTVVYEDREYPTVENAYQAAKTADPTARKAFENCSPGEAKRMGRALDMRPEWEVIKFDIMEDLVMQKFQNEELADKLLATGDGELVEGNTWGDTVWGVCKGQGQNKLGKILMRTRALIEEVRENSNKKPKYQIPGCDFHM